MLLLLALIELALTLGPGESRTFQLAECSCDRLRVDASIDATGYVSFEVHGPESATRLFGMEDDTGQVYEQHVFDGCGDFGFDGEDTCVATPGMVQFAVVNQGDYDAHVVGRISTGGEPAADASAWVVAGGVVVVLGCIGMVCATSSRRRVYVVIDG